MAVSHRSRTRHHVRALSSRRFGAEAVILCVLENLPKIKLFTGRLYYPVDLIDSSRRWGFPSYDIAMLAWRQAGRLNSSEPRYRQ